MQLHFIYRKTTVLLLLLAIGLFFVKCSGQKTNQVDATTHSSPEHYNLSSPEIIELPAYLSEISGLAYYEKDNALFAIHDENGNLYKITITPNNSIKQPNSIDIKEWKFSKKSDYEDLVLIDSTFYVLSSKGDIHQLNFDKDFKTSTQVYNFPWSDNEFESIYHDTANNKLILICKKCVNDKKKSLSTYSFNLNTKIFSDSSYAINIKQLDKLYDSSGIKFKPSAAAVHPISHHVYIISSINKTLMIASKEGEVLAAYPLSEKLFKQPEGITFNKNGDLIISNEAANDGYANILIFKYKP